MRRYKQNEVETIVSLLREDKTLSVPTDTVYGVCARVHSVEAFNKLVQVKNRPSNKNFPIMCSNLEQIESIAIVDGKAEKLISAFMPGPITLVLTKKKTALSYINNGGEKPIKSVAVRMASSPFLKEVIEGVGSPLFMSSANKSGKEVCKSLDEIEIMCPELDGMVEGEVSFGEASTIVDCTGSQIQILREGPISMKQIHKVLKE